MKSVNDIFCFSHYHIPVDPEYNNRNTLNSRQRQNTRTNFPDQEAIATHNKRALRLFVPLWFEFESATHNVDTGKALNIVY
jgi:hypothetical protein